MPAVGQTLFLGEAAVEHDPDIVAALGAEVKAKGFKALKTNIMLWQDGKLAGFGPGGR